MQAASYFILDAQRKFCSFLVNSAFCTKSVSFKLLIIVLLPRPAREKLIAVPPEEKGAKWVALAPLPPFSFVASVVSLRSTIIDPLLFLLQPRFLDNGFQISFDGGKKKSPSHSDEAKTNTLASRRTIPSFHSKWGTQINWFRRSFFAPSEGRRAIPQPTPFHSVTGERAFILRFFRSVWHSEENKPLLPSPSLFILPKTPITIAALDKRGPI